MAAKLIITDSNFNIFPLLNDELKGKVNDLTHKNYVFCEEKSSLMAERAIAAEFSGSLNTEVYSFGNFLRAEKNTDGLLSKEGSAMAVKKILSEVPLFCFKKGKTNLSAALFELISQLKSAKISPEELGRAAENTDGILSAKLKDVASVYSAYEKYMAENNLLDQSSALSLLPEIILNSEKIKGANVFIVGFSGFTVQLRQAISALLSRADSCTAILTGGKNGFAFVNETAEIFKSLCAAAGVSVAEKTVLSEYSAGGQIIKDGLFNPLYKMELSSGGKKPQAFFLAAKSVNAEADRIAEAVKRKVMEENLRYRDFTVIIKSGDECAEAFKRSFSLLDIPYFLDVKRKPENFPAAALIYAYCDLFIRGLKIPVLSAFFKNPYLSSDKNFTDRFENYLYKYDICYDKFKKPFTYAADGEDIARFNEFRAYIVGFLNGFDVPRLVSSLISDERTEELSARLTALNESEDAEINRQSAKKVKDLIAEMKFVSGDIKYDPVEFKSLFASGMAAMEISVIPQYNDAVFIGDFKSASAAKARYLFAANLTDDVPSFCEDVALLSDGDIDALEQIKLLVEPKIKVVNHRVREDVALGLSAYTDGLYLSYPLSDFTGAATVKSEILTFAEKYFDFKKFPPYDGYMTVKQGMRTFSRDCGRFASLYIDDFSAQSAFYLATKGAPERIVNYANKEIKVRLSDKGGALLRGVASPTTIEDYYACPYRSFLVHTLKVKERETGKVNALSVGNLMHEIFRRFIARVEEATDREKSDALFDGIAAEVIKKDEYAKFSDAESAFGLNLALKECKKYCYNLSRWYFSSEFKPRKNGLEVKFGDDVNQSEGYPAVSLSGGKVKLSGKIDRVDECGDYFRIIDYKTGGTEVADDKIFTGQKLQLYLYSLAITDKTLAGAYYLRVNDDYKAGETKRPTLAEGKTAVDGEVITDKEKEFIPFDGKNKAVAQSTLSAVQQYVRAMAEQAAKQLNDGVIIPSPYKGTCEYCEFSPMCRGGLAPRKVSGVDTALIEESALTAKNGGEN